MQIIIIVHNYDDKMPSTRSSETRVPDAASERPVPNFSGRGAVLPLLLSLLLLLLLLSLSLLLVIICCSIIITITISIIITIIRDRPIRVGSGTQGLAGFGSGSCQGS